MDATERFQRAVVEVARYLCEQDRKVQIARAPYDESNDERQAMYLARAEDMFRSCVTLWEL